MEVLRSQSPTHSKPSLENVLGMKGGNGDSSYANSSSCQLMMVEALKPTLERSIYESMRLKFNGEGIFRIADFGCGTGRNTLVVADTIVRALQFSFEDQEMPEFEVYFTDLRSNDFNLLFRMLPPLRQGSTNADSNLVCDNNPLPATYYMAAAVCGSLVGRNAGTQLMEEQGILGNIARHLGYAFEELVNEGIIEHEKCESFYIPWFGQNLEEMESIVKKEGSFEIKNMKVLGGVPMHLMTHWKSG